MVAAHTIASHSDTSATGAELNTLTNNSIGDALHRHSELVASDGSPDPALTMNAAGNAEFEGQILVKANSLAVANSAPGLNVVLLVENPDTTDPASRAVMQVQTGTTGGDCVVSYRHVTAQSYSHGMDRSDSDKFVMCRGLVLGVDNFLEVNASGDISLNSSVADALFIDEDGSSETNGLATWNIPVEFKAGFAIENTARNITISGGEITVNDEDQFINLSAQSGTTDDLDDINGGRVGQIIFLSCDLGDVITLKFNTGEAPNALLNNRSADNNLNALTVAAYIKAAGAWSQLWDQA